MQPLVIKEPPYHRNDLILEVLKKYPQTNFDEWELLQTHESMGTHRGKSMGEYKTQHMFAKVGLPKKDPWSRPMRDWCFEKEPKKIYTPMNAIPIVVARYTADIPSPTRWDTSVNGDVLWLWGIPSNEVSTRKYKQ